MAILQIISALTVLWISLGFLRRRLYPTVLENVPGPPGESWIAGSLNYKSDRLLVFDQKAMYHVLVKDYNIYEETDSFIEGNKIMFGHGIFTSLGDEHRRHRRMLNPVFSSAHMRQMDVFLNKVQNGPQEVDVVNWMTRLALELIGQSGLGYSFDELTETSPQHKYGLMSKKLVTMQGDEFVRDWVMPRLTRIGTPAFRKFLVDLMPFEAIAGMKEIVNVLHDTSVLIFETKKKALAEGDEAVQNQITFTIFVNPLSMKRNVLASDEDKLSDEEVLAQITSLTFAATDTTSGALSRILHQLAIHKDAQDRVREEIKEARRENGGQDIGYDELATLPYLDAVCRETLRLYPPISWVPREANEDVILPLSKPIRGLNGEEIREIPVPKGTNVSVSLLAANRDPDLWGPDALEWKPERWLNPLPEALVEAHVPGIYSHLMTFLGGGRSCLGFKFSQLEMKVVLTLLLENLEFSLSKQPIIWQMFAISTPNVDPDSVIPTMPMIISMAK
ncbi:Cytochrome P450 monooxygenase 91 [Psilocybe cubensis]|uniref:Cytochrome P450 monooxygenase 91 n=2 Tax=Psilocybe cubensis TaxID=181762 RepID=A0ACB8HCF0_PSICU|nr:Cytochrome P450 monooxygenase 91 [Psilocybe cubensis]KAH9485688.1 Cytochrome P450 monooxygenase 91 [Psilocybe cubensis]